MEEEQNQLGVMQELLLKLMDDLKILKGSQQEKEKTSAQSFTPYWNFSMIDDEEARDDFLKDEVDINKKTENRAKMTKLSMEWKRLKNQGQRPKKSKSKSIQKNQQSNRSRN
ncbi:hypothetical protein Tco_0131334, partial [Tanacetum coccineum]